MERGKGDKEEVGSKAGSRVTVEGAQQGCIWTSEDPHAQGCRNSDRLIDRSPHSITLTRSHLLTHSFAHSITHPLNPTRSLTYPSTRSHTHLLTPTLTPSQTHSLTLSLTLSLAHSLTHSLTRSLTLKPGHWGTHHPTEPWRYGLPPIRQKMKRASIRALHGHIV